MKKPDFTIRFTGRGIKPESFSIEDLQSLLVEIKNTVKSDSNDIVTISLVSIRRKSAAYSFVTSDTESPDGGLSKIIDSLKAPQTDSQGRQRGLFAHLERVNRNKDCRVHLLDSFGKKAFEFKRKAGEPLPGKLFREWASVVGKVVNVGGARKPQAEIVCRDGHKVFAYGSEEQIKKLAMHLYQEVRLDGFVFADQQTGVVKMEDITGMASHKHGGIADVFAELRENFGDKLNLGEEVSPVLYQREIRG
ncbi:MAG: hypothetical protein LBR94_09555 [Desulfovibrio sp.]|jgi:hypothetical protein|nr:hypothetical protein [Desulfovibrio sp.]